MQVPQMPRPLWSRGTLKVTYQVNQAQHCYHLHHAPCMLSPPPSIVTSIKHQRPSKHHAILQDLGCSYYSKQDRDQVATHKIAYVIVT